MLNSKQVRQIFNVTNQTLFNWRKSGKLPYIDIGSKGYLYKRSDIMNILGLKEEKINAKRKNKPFFKLSPSEIEMFVFYFLIFICSLLYYSIFLNTL